MKDVEKAKGTDIEMIPCPTGSVGTKGFSLIAEMCLNGSRDYKDLYNNILVRWSHIQYHQEILTKKFEASVCSIAHKGGIDFNKTFRQQPMTIMGKIQLAVSGDLHFVVSNLTKMLGSWEGRLVTIVYGRAKLVDRPTGRSGFKFTWHAAFLMWPNRIKKFWA
jgi:hypothetical protein